MSHEITHSAECMGSSITYSAVGSILTRLRQTFVTISFTIYTIEASRTGTSVPIDYVLHVNEQYSIADGKTCKIDSLLVC